MLETESQVRDLPGARPAPRFHGQIEFADVSFGYVPEHLVFDFVALGIGPTGSGKSTLIGMVARFYDPVSGAIKIDGRVDFNTRQSLRTFAHTHAKLSAFLDLH